MTLNEFILKWVYGDLTEDVVITLNDWYLYLEVKEPRGFCHTLTLGSLHTDQVAKEIEDWLEEEDHLLTKHYKLEEE